MPLPMVHLATAREYAHDIPELFECPEFYLGCISPDAIHMRENTDRKDKDVTHLLLPSKTFPWVNNSLEKRKDNAIYFLKQNKNKSNYNFLLGYGIHLLTDIIWYDTLFTKFGVIYEKDSNPLQNRILAYYNDTDTLDFELFRTYKWRSHVWGLLEKAKLSDVDGILTAGEINGWNNHVLHWFDSGESHHKNPIRYLSLDEVTEFIQKAGKEIRNLLLLEGL